MRYRATAASRTCSEARDWTTGGAGAGRGVMVREGVVPVPARCAGSAGP
jgi:hypothetical protein